MVIEISNATYRKGWGQRLDSVSIPGLLAKLNALIEWDHCLFPPKVKEGTENEWEEDRKFLGDEPELRVGLAFKYGNQLLALEDENTLVLVMSETGIGGLQRVWKEKIVPEIDIVFNSETPEDLQLEKVDSSEVPEEWETKQIPYETMKLLRDKMIPGREDLFEPKNMCVKTTMRSNTILFPIHLYLTDWGFKYDPNELEEDELEFVEKELVSGLYEKYPRKKISTEDPYEKRNKAVREAREAANKIMDELKGAMESAEEIDEEDDTDQGNSGQPPIPALSPTKYSDIFTDVDDEEDKIEEYKGKLYYKVSRGDLMGTGDIATILELSDIPNGLEDSDYEKFGVKFESDFPEYRVAELMESVFEVCDDNTFNYADETKLEEKLKNHPDYEEGQW